MATRNGKLITSLDQLCALYGEPTDVSIAKEIDHVSDHYRAFIEAAPFFALATVGPEGLDCSPRGDAPGFVRIADPRRCWCRTAAATTASTACATSCAIRAWRSCS